MQRKYVTSMSRAIFDAYGREFLETFVDRWPEGDMHVYVEEGDCDFAHPRVKYQPLYEVPGLQAFLAGTEHFPIFEGYTTPETRDYRYMVRRFCRKAFAQMHAACDYRGFLIWLDCDIVTHKAVPAELIDSYLRDDSAFIAVMKRKDWHLCSSFVMWDCAHAFAPGWWMHYARMYEDGVLFALPQWDDAYVLEQTLSSLPGVHDIAADVTGDGPYNVFDLVFGEYAKHDKGPAKLAKVAA